MTRCLRPLSSPRHVRGISLIEVMVSVLILSVGLLGSAAMQSLALRGGQGSLESSQAVMQTSSILEAMRANPTANYNMTPKQCTLPTATTTLVSKDKLAWVQALKSTIGDTAKTCGQIACASRVCTITVFWDDTRAGGTDTRSIVTSARI